jgi:hypothetical protein
MNVLCRRGKGSNRMSGPCLLLLLNSFFFFFFFFASDSNCSLSRIAEASFPVVIITDSSSTKEKKMKRASRSLQRIVVRIALLFVIIRCVRVAQRIVVYICNHSPEGKKHGKASLRAQQLSNTSSERMTPNTSRVVKG